MQEWGVDEAVKVIDGKSILLGIGLGTIITSILGVIFFLGYQPQLSDSQIIEKARKLGMVDQFEKGTDIRRNADGSLTFTIREGESFTDVSKRLLNAGIISSSIEFEIVLKKEGLEKSIQPGEYIIHYDDTIKEIVRKITGTN